MNVRPYQRSQRAKPLTTIPQNQRTLRTRRNKKTSKQQFTAKSRLQFKFKKKNLNVLYFIYLFAISSSQKFCKNSKIYAIIH